MSDKKELIGVSKTNLNQSSLTKLTQRTLATRVMLSSIEEGWLS